MSKKVDALLEKLRERIAAAPPARASLSVVGAAPGAMDQVTRESHIKMIGHLRKRYGLSVIVDQATFGKVSADQLTDEELVELHRDLERARDCLAEGITLEDAGLLRSRYA